MTDSMQTSAIMTAGENMTLEELVHNAAEYELEHPELLPKNAKII